MIDANRRRHSLNLRNAKVKLSKTIYIDRINCIRKKVQGFKNRENIYIYIYKIKERKKAFAYKALKEIYKWRYFKRKISSISFLGEIFVSNELRHGADMFYHILQS